MTYAMSCTDCLSLVATADLGELTTGAAVTEHCRTCADCASVVDAVAEEAQRLADTLDGTPPGIAAHVVALRAVAGASRNRRRRRQWRIAGVTVAATGTLLAALMLSRMGPGPNTYETRTVELQCLAPEQAAELARGSLPAATSVSFRPSIHLPILTVRGTPRDLATAEQVIARIDARWGAERSAYCASMPNGMAPHEMEPGVAAPAPAPALAPAHAGPR